MNKKGRPPKYTPEEARQAKLESGRRAGAKWRANNPRNEYYRKYDSQRTGQNVLYRAAQSRSRINNLPFDIAQSDIDIPAICPICEQEMFRSNNGGGTSSSPTLDKVEPEKGYVKGNIAVICKLCNSTKGSGSAELHRKIADYIDRFKSSFSSSSDWGA